MSLRDWFTALTGSPNRREGKNGARVDDNESGFRGLVDAAPVMIWMSAADGRHTYFNQQWLHFTGHLLQQELGDGWAEGIHPDDYTRCTGTYNSAVDERTPFKMEYRRRNREGAFRWIIDIGAPRLSPNGEFLGHIGSCLDITDHRLTEDALQEALNDASDLKNRLEEQNSCLQEEIELEHNFHEMIGSSDAIKYVLYKIQQVAPTETTVLVQGETGTGKELVARAIHSTSGRKDRPLVKVNCAALPASLIETELFGHEKGAFTGAISRKLGRFEVANNATLFLDEVGELPLELQPKLLRVLQEGEFERLGSSTTLRVDVRIIAATNRNLKREVQKGLFREDLWYRLEVFPITVPPLNQRREDIPLLVEHFAGRSSKKLGRIIQSICPSTMKRLQNHSWPGNVRELENVIERAIISASSPVLRLEESFQTLQENDLPLALKTLEQIESEYVLRVLDQTGWKIEGQNGAARILGLNPSTLRTRMVKLGIHRPGARLS
jgi:PAS domain S-box-containing protein